MDDDQEERLRKLRRLTPQQRAVLRLRCQRYSLKQIGEALVIEERTVKYHMARIYVHLELDDLPHRVRPMELALYCPLLPLLESEPPPAQESEPEPIEQPQPGALVAVDEDERAVLLSPRPDIVIHHQAIPAPTLEPRPRVSRGLAITLVTGIVVIAALAGALAMSLLSRPTQTPPAIVSVVVTATPVSQPVAQLQSTAVPALAPATATPNPAAVAAKPTDVPTSAPTATRVPPTNTAQPPTPTPKPQPGDLLYEADWSNGLNGWVGGSDWKVSNGMLLNDGTKHESRIQAPRPVDVDDYAVEAEIQQPQAQAGWFLLFLRGEGEGGYTIGVDRDRYKMLWLGDRILVGSNQLAQHTFSPGTGWRTYRLEAKGNRLTVLVDGGVFLQATDGKYLSGGTVGLLADMAPLMVRTFKILAL